MGKIGVFGGSFDPFHFGHLESLTAVSEKLDLDVTKVIPNCVGPLRVQTQGASAEQRLEMCRLGLQNFPGHVQVDDLEIRRGGISYTVDTMKELTRQNAGDRFYLTIGLDQFQKFDQWKNFEEILTLADLVVTSRPGLEFPYAVDRFPGGMRALVEDFDGKQALLKNGQTIHFVQIPDVEVSATEIRKKIRLGQIIHDLVPAPVEEYLRENKIYESLKETIKDYEAFSKYCARILIDKGGVQVRAFDLRAKSAPSEFTAIASGTSTRHATSLAESLVKEVKKEYGIWPQSVEGQGEGRWVVIDYGSLIVHSFYDYVRQEYRLEELWRGGVELSL